MAKYSFETTTVGEMLDTPEIMEIIQKNIPDVLEHPLLETSLKPVPSTLSLTLDQLT